MAKRPEPKGPTPGVHFRLPEETKAQLKDLQDWLAQQWNVPQVTRTQAVTQAVREFWQQMAKKFGKELK